MRKQLHEALEKSIIHLEVNLAQDVWDYFFEMNKAAGRYVYLRDAANSETLDRLAYWRSEEWDKKIDKLIEDHIEDDEDDYYELN